MGWLCQWRRGEEASEFDRLWLRFRDRWGLFWSQRVREQFMKYAWVNDVLRAGFRTLIDGNAAHSA